MITLPRDANVAALEEFVREIRQYPGQDLKLAIHTSRSAAFSFGGVSVQAIATWARLHEGARRIHVPPSFANDSATRDRFASVLHGMAALYFCDSIVSGSQEVKRFTALSSVTPRVAAMESFDLANILRGRSTALCCFEGAKAEFLPALYEKPRRGSKEQTSVRSIADLRSVLLALIDACAPGMGSRLSEGQAEVLGNLVHQLFKNADVHTVTDASGKLSTTGIRGVQVRYISAGSSEALVDFAQNDHSLRVYLGRATALSSKDQRIKALATGERKERRPTSFLEVSVFDTGPGLALRWLSKERGIQSYAQMTLEDEEKAIHDCFRLHSTTHSSSSRGDGLEIAMLAMRQLRAFMFLRTGRLALVQDFSTGTHQGFAPRHRYGSTKSLGEIAGASYSISFPLHQ
jgi:hypothetical protein